MSAFIFYLENTFTAMIACLGFALIFNVPRRYLIFTLLLAGIGHTSRAIYVNEFDGHLVMGTLIASVTIGLLGTMLSRLVERPSPIFTYPAIIPMVPGVYSYKAMMGLFKTLYSSGLDLMAMKEAILYGLKAFFIFMALAVGVAFTSIILGRSSNRHV